MDKYDETYELVINVARAKMIMNAHKGNIEEVDPDVLLKCINEEVEELSLAMHEPFDYFHIIEEVADILNFAIAAAHTALNGYRGRKKHSGYTESMGVTGDILSQHIPATTVPKKFTRKAP